jgi:predicted PurR-regulated permease PerM
MGTPMQLLAYGLCFAAALVFLPLWVPLLVAAWFADLLRPLARRLERVLGGRRSAAAAVVVLLVLCVLVPLAGITASLAAGVSDLLHQVRAALEGKTSLSEALLGAGGTEHRSLRDWVELASKYGAHAWDAALSVARVSANVVVKGLVFVVSLYAFVVDGERIGGWLKSHAPISPDAFSRLARAFQETGRGLIIATGGTALIQGAIATVTYVAIGIGRAFILGPLTTLSALVPILGTSLVWVPLAIGLFVSRDYARCAVLVVVGAGVLSLVDNFVRPVLAKYGHLGLPTFVVLLSMIGGVAFFGASGLLLGPLAVRLCAEALDIVSGGNQAKGPSSGSSST